VGTVGGTFDFQLATTGRTKWPIVFTPEGKKAWRVVWENRENGTRIRRTLSPKDGYISSVAQRERVFMGVHNNVVRIIESVNLKK